MMKTRILYSLLIFFSSSLALAGPPFLTDDPEPVSYHHEEINVFSSLAVDPRGTLIQPLFETNFGAVPNIQLHFNIPYAFLSPTGGGNRSGVGDAEAGVKFRFLQADEGSLQMAFYPAVEIPTGDSSRGLGNGQAWWRFPFWIQKTWGPWTTFGGGGYAVNSAPGALNYFFGGWVLQYGFTEKFSLGVELYGQGADSQGPQEWALWNIGGTYQMDWLGCNLIFSAGHNLAGESRTVAFLGLNWNVDFSKNR